MINTLFISDLHLSGEQPEIIELFLEFMKRRACHSPTLYILGDLFEVWIGDDYIDNKLVPVVKALREYTEQGNQLFVMHGNRDFLLGQQFAVQTGCTLLPDPYLIKLNGVKTALSHGDMFCTDDVDYQAFKTMVRDPKWQQEFLANSVEQRVAFASSVRDKSRYQTSAKATEIMDVNQASINHHMKALAVTQLIHGHTHRPNTHHFTLNNQQVTRYVLGDWHEHGSVMEFNNNCFSMQTLELGSVMALV